MIEEFLRIVLGFEDELTRGYFQIWTFPGKTSFWFRSIIETKKKIEEQVKRERNVYLGVGISPKEWEPDRRCPAEEVIGVFGIVADLDVAGPGHKNQAKLFADSDEAGSFIGSLPLQPSLVISSGGGLQAWWLYKEPWYFEDKEENRQAEDLAHGWGRLMSDSAAKINRQADSMWDLARVMRVPGTSNFKTGSPRPVKLVSKSGPRYDPGDFEPWRWRPKLAIVSGGIGSISLDPDAKPDLDKLHVSLMTNTKFRATWERRANLKDTSQSAHDMSLANSAALDGWGPQDIADLLIAFRRLGGVDLKLNRLDYYQGTIDKALEFALNRRQATEAEEVIETTPEVAEVADSSPGDREKLLALIKSTTGVGVSKLVRHGEVDATYSLITSDGKDVQIGTVAALLSWTTWSRLAFEHGTVLRGKPGAKEMMTFHRALKMIVERESSEDVGEEQVVFGWVREFGLRGPVVREGLDGKELFDIICSDGSFRQDGKIFVRIESLRHHIKNIYKEKLTRAELLRLLKVVGFSRKDVAARSGQKVVNRCYWWISENSVGAATNQMTLIDGTNEEEATR